MDYEEGMTAGELNAFIVSMRNKMREHGGKGRKFAKSSVWWLMCRMMDEFKELEEAYNVFILDPTEDNREAMRKECADIGNFAAFIHVNVGDEEKYKKREFKS